VVLANRISCSKKCLVVATHNNLTEAHAWIDANLEPIRKSIPDGLDPPSSLLPWRLDKPVYLASSHTYADILKKNFSTTPTPTTSGTTNHRPPRKRQAALIDYDSDSSTAPTVTTVASTATNQSAVAPPPAPSATTTQYTAELLALQNEITALQNIITSAIAEIKNAILSTYKDQTMLPISNATETDHPMETQEPNQPLLDLQATIHDLKHDIATIVIARNPRNVPPTSHQNDASPSQNSIRHLNLKIAPVWVFQVLLRLRVITLKI